MYLKHLEIKNFRGFSEFSLPLLRHVNVLIGDNQAGKTSILDALSIAISCIFQGLRTGHSEGINLADVHRIAYLRNGTIEMPEQYPVELKCQGELDGKPIGWTRRLKGKERRTTRALTELGAAGARYDQAIQAGQTVDLPVIAYFGTERVARERKTRKTTPESIKDRSLGYKDCLERDSNFRLIRGWIKSRTLAATQKAQRGLPGDEAPRLRALERAVCRCVPDASQFFFDHEFNDLAIVFTDQRRLPWSMLSDGVRSLATLAMDVAWRTLVLNPHLGEESPQRSSGVVLIDEVDLALHPNWQRRVISDLREAFPRLQFVATTHSPFIVQALRPGELINLSRPQEAPYADKSIEDIAEQTMGVPLPQHSERYQRMMKAAEDYFRLLRAARPTDRAALAALKARLDELSLPFSDDPAYQALLKVEREAAGLGRER